MPSIYQFENKLISEGCNPVAGVDEVGRGAWAGPLVAAAVILNKNLYKLDDSKKLRAIDRKKLYDRILKHSFVSVGVTEIIEINIHGLTWANHMAMKRAISGLSTTPEHILVDYIRLPKTITNIEQTCITKGDSISASIAAASIVAKVTRDRLMSELHHADKNVQPFSFHKNFGYGTSHHRESLMEFGPTRYHRQFYTPVVESRQTSIPID